MEKTYFSEICMEAVEKVAYVADKTVEQGKQLIEQAALQKRLATAQRQLGALVYSLNKRNEENTLLVARYIDTITEIERKIDKAKGKTQENPQARSFVLCPICGSKCKKNSSFCNTCGEHM